MEQLRQAYKKTALLGGAMIAALFIYAVVVEVIRSQQAPFSGFASFPEIKVLSYVLYVLALLQIVLTRVVPRLLLKKDPTDDLQSLIGKLNASAIITYALCETPAIYGLVLFFLGGLYRDFYLLLAYSLGLQLIHFPRYSRWEEWVKLPYRVTG
jgi:F0F1-type ATP synthase membrane subunit c/vacuolar-type H+-ATPase subunit K